MPLPSARNRTYTGANSIVPGDLDDIQDCIIGAKHGDKVLDISPLAVVFFSGNGGFGQGPTRAISTSGVVMMYALPFRVGDRVKSLTFARKGDDIVDITGCSIVKTTSAMVDSNYATLAGLPVNNIASAAWADATLTPGAPAALIAGECLSFQVQVNATGFQMGNIRVTFDRP